MTKKILGKKDLVLFTVSAILLLDTLASAASVGVSSIFWWLFLSVVFFIPFALISAEMSCSYPAQGGIYAWVKTAYGSRWAARASWSYWIIVGAFNYVDEHGMANDFTIAALKPDWQASFQYIPAIIYGMLGFELVSASSEEMKDPARDMPKAVLISALIIIVLYMLGTVAMLAAIPAKDINLVEGLMDTLYLLFGQSTAGKTFAMALGIMALFTFFSNGVTWALGCNRAAAEAAKTGELPAIFGLASKKTGTPLGASIMMGLVSTGTIVLYGFLAGSNEDLFWSLFAFSAVIFMLPYIGMLLAFVKARVEHPNHSRPYKIPGGLFFARLSAYSCIAVLSFAIVLFIYSPENGMQWSVFIGVVVTLIIGELAINSAEKTKAETKEKLELVND